MVYQVQTGDTIAEVTGLMKTDWATLRRLNPHAIGQSSRTGNWFLKEGTAVKGKEDFGTVLRKKMEAPSEAAPLTPKVSRAEPSATSGAEKWVEYTIKPGDNLWTLAVKRFHTNLKDLLADNAFDDPNKIQPGTKIRVRIPSLPPEMNVVASWYGGIHQGRAMANGRPYDQHAPTIAHRCLPFGTQVELENPSTKERASAVVTDRGPYVAGRDVDLSYHLAQKLSIVKKGVGPLVMRVIGKTGPFT